MYIGDKKIEDWGIVTSFELGTPDVIKKEYEVPGRSGTIDASEALTGYPVYKNRHISIELYVPGNTPEEYQSIYDEIKGYCHGRNRAVVFPFDKDFYYEGRWKVGSVKNARGYVTISGDCYPYALKNEMTVIDISSTKASAREVILPNAGMPTKLVIETDREISINRGNSHIAYPKGKTTVYAPLLTESEIITVTGIANATISYQEGKI